MNYLKLNLGGKERGAKLGLLFLENLQKAENKNIQELFEELENPARLPFVVPKFIYYSLITNCQMNGNDVDFTMVDVYDWIEEEGISNKDGSVVKFIDAFVKNMTKLFPPEATSGKIKPTKKASTPMSGSKM